MNKQGAIIELWRRNEANDHKGQIKCSNCGNWYAAPKIKVQNGRTVFVCPKCGGKVK